MSFFVVAADPALGSAGTLRAYAGHLGGCCVVISAREPVEVDLAGMVAMHRSRRALLTLAVRSLAEDADGSQPRPDAILAGEDDRVLAVQPAPHPDEALSDLVDAGVYVVAVEALDHVREGASELARDVLSVLLAWDSPVYVHRLMP